MITYYHQLRRISAPQSEIISLAEAKLYLRVDHADEDVLISEQIVAVRMFAEDYLGRSLVTQDWEVYYLHMADCYKLVMHPVQEILEVIFSPSEGVENIVPASDYHFTTPNILTFSHVPDAMVRIKYRAGVDALNVSYALKQAMLAHIALCYECRGNGVMNLAPAHHLYAPYKEVYL